MFGRTLSAEELARDVEGLAADNNHLLAVEELLGDDTGKTTQQVTLAVNDNLQKTLVSHPHALVCVLTQLQPVQQQE